MLTLSRFSPTFLALLIAAAGCQAGTGDGGGPSGTGAGPGVGGTGGGGESPGVGGATATVGAFMVGSGGGAPCDGVGDDEDEDGFTLAEGDCNDCDPNVSPGAIEVIAEDAGTGGGGGAGGGAAAVDEDCDGTVDNIPPATCDDGIALNTTDPMDGARAIELCHQVTGPKDYGVISAQWVRANGQAASASPQFGVQSNFGPNVPVRAGANMLALASGRARLPGQPDECAGTGCYGYGAGSPPPNFPQTVSGCSTGTNVNDDVGLEVALRAPTNATGYKFDFKFYTFEYPTFVCSTWNDQYITLVSPPPMGSINGNISFDSQNNPVSVNVAFFDVCSGCPQGTGELTGTGFEGHGATTWLQTTAPVDGGSVVTIRFTIWDTADSIYDSTVIADNFRWIASGGTVNVGTVPVPQ